MSLVNREEYLTQLKTLVNIDSGSYDPDGINRVADQLEAWFRALGWHIQTHDLGPETGRMLEISNRPADHYDVLFVGHMDTVFPAGTVAKRPFTMDDTYAYGPGVGDMKNGDVAIYQVVTHLSTNALQKLNIGILYNPDEEIGSIYSREAMDQIGARADHIYVMESVASKNAHCFARKGRMTYTIQFHGQAAHAGFMFERENASAILELGHYVVELMALADREADTTVNVGVVRGGTAPNVVADEAELVVEMRFKTASEEKRLRDAVNTMLARPSFVPGVRVEISEHHAMPAWRKTPESLAHIALMESIAKNLNIEFAQKDRGGLSDANHLSAVCPCCSDGMGPHGAMDHSEKEYSTINSVEPCVQLLVGLLEHLADNKH